MTTNRPEVVAIMDMDNGGLIPQRTAMGISHGTQLIRLRDYEALQAECEQLRKLLSAAANYAARMEPMSAKLLNAIDDALQEPPE